MTYNRKKEKEDRQRSRVQIALKLDPEYDEDVIRILAKQDNKQGFIKSLILESEKEDDLK